MLTRTLSLLLAAASLTLSLGAQTLPKSTFIRVDQFGYLPSVNKVAVLARALEGYDAGMGLRLDVGTPVQLIDEDGGAVVFEAYAKTWNGGAEDELSGDHGWWFDFSEVTAPGAYRIRATQNDGSTVDSYGFRIGEDVYEDVLRAAVNFYYYQRVNQVKTAEYASGAPWTDDAWYDRPDQERAAKLLDDPTVTRDLRGGWIDAGDPNKYVTFASDPVHGLLGAYTAQETFWRDFDLRIPESGDDVPDLLDEVQWEIAWVKRMQDFGTDGASGGIHQKMGILDDGAYISPPSTDARDRYFNGVCVNSTITGAGMMAHAAAVYAGVPALADEAAELTARAEAAWAYYVAAPDKSERCDDGRIEAGDADGPGEQYSVEHVAEAVVAAVYLYEATGAPAYRDFVEANFRRTRPFNADPREWAVYRTSQGEAVLHYAMAVNPGSAAAAAIRARKEGADKSASGAYRLAEADNLYRADLIYFNWGSNSLAGSQAADVMDFLEHGLRPELSAAHTERAGGLLNYLHGTNPMGLCYLSNMYRYGGDFCADEMWHTWFRYGTAYDGTDGEDVGPAPGFLSGGPNPQGNAAMPIKLGGEQFGATAGRQPHQKAFSVNNDPNVSYGPWAYNEPAIYYNGNYIRALSFFAAGEVGSADTVEFGMTGETFEAEDVVADGSSVRAESPGDGIAPASGGRMAVLTSRSSGTDLAFSPVSGGPRQITLRVGLPTSGGEDVRRDLLNYRVSVNGQAVTFALDTTTRSFESEAPRGWGTIVTEDVSLTAGESTTVNVHYVGEADGSSVLDLVSYREPRAVPTYGSGGDSGGGLDVCLEAEDAFSVANDAGGFAVAEDTFTPGYTGRGYVNLFDVGDAAAVTVAAPEAGAATVRLRVRVGERDGTDRNLAPAYAVTLGGEPLALELDPETISELADDTYWGELVGEVDLAAGDNDLRIEATAMWLKFDRLCATMAPAVGLTEAPAGVGLAVTPNPTRDRVTVTLTGARPTAKGYRVELVDASGRVLRATTAVGPAAGFSLGEGRASGLYLARVTDLAAGWTLTRSFLVQ